MIDMTYDPEADALTSVSAAGKSTTRRSLKHSSMTWMPTATSLVSKSSPPAKSWRRAIGRMQGGRARQVATRRNSQTVMRKLLDKQKEGKKRMRQFGKVDIPQEAFIAALKVDV